MKRILTILILFVCGTASAQVYQRMPQYGYEMQRAKMDSVLQVPGDTVRNKTGVARIGTKLYAGNGTYWTEAGGTTIDTTGIRLRPVAGPGISITGTYPNLTFSGNPDTLTAADPLQLSTVSTKRLRLDFRRDWLDSLLALQVDSSGLLDSALLRNDSLFTYTGGIESYRGKVSGVGGGTLQDIMTGANKNAANNFITLGTNAGENASMPNNIVAIGNGAAESSCTEKLIAIGDSSLWSNCSSAGDNVALGISAGNYYHQDGNIYNAQGKSTFIGNYSNGYLLSGFLENATAIGYRSYVEQSNSLVLGSIAGVNGASASTSVGIGTTTPTAPLHVVGAPRFATDSAAAGYVWTAKDNTGQGEWRVAAGGSGVTTAQLTDSLNAREPRYKFRDDSTGNGGYTTLFQNGLKANTADPTFTGTVTTPMLRVTGRTSLQGVTINKDSLPITTTNRWAVTVDTPTNMLQRFDLERKADTFNQVFTGSISLNSTTGGIGLPAMTQTQMNAISSPAVGVQVYNTTYDAVCTNTSDFGWWSNDGAWQRANGFSYSEEFLITTTSAIGLIYGNFAGQQNNSSALSNVVATSNRPGIVQLSTQSSATGRPVLVMDAVASRTNIVGGGKIIYETQVQIPALSSASETFNFFTGLSSSTSNVSTNAIAFLYDSAGTNAGSSAIGRWQVVCSNGSARSYTTSNVQVTAGQWYSLRAVINAAGTQVDFYIDGTLVKSETNNIPTGGVSYTYALTKTNGTTARSALVDYFFMRQKFTTTR